MGEVIKVQFGESPAARAREQLIGGTMRFFGITREEAVKEVERLDKMTIAEIDEEIKAFL